MSNSIFSLSAASLALAMTTLVSPAQARTAIVCDEDGCAQAIIVPGPVLVVIDED